MIWRYIANKSKETGSRGCNIYVDLLDIRYAQGETIHDEDPDLDDDELLNWSADLDFEEYCRDWFFLGTSGCSDGKDVYFNLLSVPESHRLEDMDAKYRVGRERINDPETKNSESSLISPTRVVNEIKVSPPQQTKLNEAMGWDDVFTQKNNPNHKTDDIFMRNEF